MDIKDLIKQSGTQDYVSIFGKSTVPQDSAEYKFVEEVTEILILNDYGVIHGGYNGGMMQAVADTAHRILVEKKLPLERNIAVPQLQHDAANWSRVQAASFTEPARDIFDRLRNVAGNSDVAVVAPLGGDGTLLEVAVIWHENSLAKYTGAKIVPLIILTTDKGTNWRKILEVFIEELDSSHEPLELLDWVYFVSSPLEFKETLRKIRQSNNLL